MASMCKTLECRLLEWDLDYSSVLPSSLSLTGEVTPCCPCIQLLIILFDRYFRQQREKYNGNPPPEVRLVIGQVGAVLMPISLFWFAFTTYPHVHWIVPIIASVPFGTGIFFAFAAIFTFTVTAYRPIAASAMAANTFVRTTSAAAFPLFAGQMYSKLGTVGATALLAGLTTVAAPLPYVCVLRVCVV